MSAGGGKPSPDRGSPVAGAPATDDTNPASGSVTSPSSHEQPASGGGAPSPAGVQSPAGAPSPDGGNPVAGAPATDDTNPASGTDTSPTSHEPPASGGGASSPAGAQSAFGAAGQLPNTANPSFTHSSSVDIQHSGGGMSAIIAGWSSLPSAFTKALLTLQSHPSIQISIQAIASLQATVQATISTYGSCSSCNGLSFNSALSTQFKAILTQIFTSWQRIIIIGQANYGAQWQASTNALFERFSTFLVSVKSIAAAIHIDLGSLFGAIHLDTHLFAGFGINISGLTNFNLAGGLSGGLDLHKLTGGLFL